MSRKSSVDSVEKAQKIFKKIPSTDNGPIVDCNTRSGQRYIVSWCIERMKFTLWQVVDGGYMQIRSAKSPLDLYQDIPWEK